MKRERRTFTAEFKDEAVHLALSGEKKMSETARNLGLGVSTLQNWISEYRAKTGGETASKEITHFQLTEENRRLREENRRLQMERDILKKATAFFANENK